MAYAFQVPSLFCGIGKYLQIKNMFIPLMVNLLSHQTNVLLRDHDTEYTKTAFKTIFFYLLHKLLSSTSSGNLFMYIYCVVDTSQFHLTSTQLYISLMA